MKYEDRELGAVRLEVENCWCRQNYSNTRMPSILYFTLWNTYLTPGNSVAKYKLNDFWSNVLCVVNFKVRHRAICSLETILFDYKVSYKASNEQQILSPANSIPFPCEFTHVTVQYTSHQLMTRAEMMATSSRGRSSSPVLTAPSRSTTSIPSTT